MHSISLLAENICWKEVSLIILNNNLLLYSNSWLILYIDTLMLSVYEQRKDLDGFLYIVYTEETTLGSDEIEDEI